MLSRIRHFVRPWLRENHSVEEWNRQYSSSTWVYLTSLEQAPRYAIIEAWRRRIRPSGSVLDLGCGEGVLFEQIPEGMKVNYTGVDLAQVAIDVASKKIRDLSTQRFVCADLVTFDPPPGLTFDVIIFNEVLYYFADPLAVVRRYRKALAPSGLIIVSIFHRNFKVWKAVDKSLKTERLQTTFVRDFSSGKRWYLGLYQDKRAA